MHSLQQLVDHLQSDNHTRYLSLDHDDLSNVSESIKDSVDDLYTLVWAARGNRAILRLNIFFRYNIDHECFPFVNTLVSNLPSLHTLQVEMSGTPDPHERDTDSPLKALELSLGGSSRLKTIHLKRVGVGMLQDEGEPSFNWNVFHNHQHLECLDISTGRSLPQSLWWLCYRSMATVLTCLPKLRKVSCSNCVMATPALGCCDSSAALMSQPSLEPLELDHLQLSRERATQSFVKDLSTSPTPSIQDLSLGMFEETRSVFAEIETMTSLRKLSLSLLTPGLRDKIYYLFSILLSNNALQRLSITDVEVVVEDISLPTTPLKSLSLVATDVSITGIARILSKLTHAAKSLEEVIITTNAITSANLAVDSGCGLGTLLEHVETALQTLPLKRLRLQRQPAGSPVPVGTFTTTRRRQERANAESPVPVGTVSTRRGQVFVERVRANTRIEELKLDILDRASQANVDSLIRLNAAGRSFSIQDGSCRLTGIRVLAKVSHNTDDVLTYLLENPSLVR